MLFIYFWVVLVPIHWLEWWIVAIPFTRLDSVVSVWINLDGEEGGGGGGQRKMVEMSTSPLHTHTM